MDRYVYGCTIEKKCYEPGNKKKEKAQIIKNK